MVLEDNRLDQSELEAKARQVIAACQRGDRDAFRDLFEAYQDKVYSIALRYSGDRAVALDIAQEIFLKLLSNIHEFHGNAGFETWLYRVVVNCCLDHRRRSRRIGVFLENLLHGFTAPRQSVLQDLMRVEMQEQVQRGIAGLSADQRIAVALRYTEGLSYEQIAEILDCSPGTVASRLNRAHKVLERRLAHLRERR
jgi:RNA polymerase sigma-70 factor (ECF subfamily)